MNYLEIVDVQGREILDSRGNPTVEAEITLADGTVARGCAPKLWRTSTLSSLMPSSAWMLPTSTPSTRL